MYLKDKVHCTKCVQTNMGEILVTDGMAKSAILKLKHLGHNVIEKHYTYDELITGVLANYDAVIIRSATKITKSVIESTDIKGNKLGFIGRAGVGVDNIDIISARNAGIIVCNTPQSSTHSVVELTLGHLLSSVRYISRGTHSLKSGEWIKKDLKGTELSGKNLGLIGFGRIAQGVAKVAHALGMNLHCYDPYLNKDIADKHSCTLHNDVNDVFKNCTHISIHCNLTDETHHLVNYERILLMPDIGYDGVNCGRHIVNCARGGILNEADVKYALDNDKLTSVSIDVFEKEPPDNNDLLNHHGFQGTPHIGGSTIEAQMRIGEEICLILIDYFEGKRPHSALN